MNDDLVIFERKEERYSAMLDTTPIRALMPPGKIACKYFSAIKSHSKCRLSKFILLQKDATKDQQ